MDLNFRINLLKISYLFQITLLIIILLFNIFYKNSIIWLKSLQNLLYTILLLILFIIAIAPIVLFIIVYLRKTFNIFFRLLKISLGLTLISLIISIGIIIFQIIANKNYPIFYKYCPFNYNLYDIELVFNDFQNGKNTISNNKILELKEECNNRRCINLEGNNFYICNFNSLDVTDDNSIICGELPSKDMFESEIIKTYINLCNTLVDFYLCVLSKEPNKYPITSDYICPTKQKKSITLEIIVSFLNISFPIIIYILQYFYYKKILKIIVTNNIRRTANDNGANKTVDTSKRSGLNNDNTKSFKKDQTELIIVANDKNEGEVFQIYNKNKKKNNQLRNILKNKTELFSLNNSTINPYLYKHSIKNNKKNNDNIRKKSIKNENNYFDGKNRSFTSTLNYNNKINDFDSMRILTQININEEKTNYANQEKVNHNSNDNDNNKIKCIIIKK